jgi:YD repeat-containing protein
VRRKGDGGQADLGVVLYSATLTYDLAGRVIKKTSRDGTWIEYAYDASGRLLQETRKSKSGKSTKTLYTQTYMYDAAGNRTGFTRPVTLDQLRDRDDIPRCVRMSFRGHKRGITAVWVAAYTYDDANKLLSWTKALRVNGKNYVTKTVAYTYDAHGNRTKKTETDADGSVEETTYAYDPLHQLVSVGSDPGHRSRSSTYTYNGAGLLVASDNDPVLN